MLAKTVPGGRSAIERTTMRKMMVRIVALVGILYITSLLDRLNTGYAALPMNADLGLSTAEFGLGAGLFFAGYLLAELPSNLMMLRFGSRLWLGRIMISWGIVSACMALAQGASSFYALRILLGVAEAGFLPGAMLYLAQWVPARHRSQAVLAFFALGQIGGLVGAPLSGWILSHDTMLGMKDWQALYVIEALPAIVLGVVVLRWLPNTPAEAPWLTGAERGWLERELSTDHRAVADHGLEGLGEGLRNWRVWALFVAKFANGLAVYTIALWLPQMAKARTGLPVETIGWIVALPSLVAIPSMWIAGTLSDRTCKRPQHAMTALTVCACCAFGAATLDMPIVGLVLIGAAGVSAIIATGLSWAIAPGFLQGRAAAGAFAIINAGGITAGFVGGSAIGWLRQVSGDFDSGLYLVAVICVLGAGALWLLMSRSFDNDLTKQR